MRKLSPENRLRRQAADSMILAFERGETWLGMILAIILLKRATGRKGGPDEVLRWLNEDLTWEDA